MSREAEKTHNISLHVTRWGLLDFARNDIPAAAESRERYTNKPGK